MRQALFAVLLLLPVAAVAQQPPQPSPQVQAMTQTILKLTGEAIDWQTQALAAKQEADAERSTLAARNKELADLRAQLAAKTAPPPPAPKKE